MVVVVVGKGHQKILSSNTMASHTYCAVLRGDIKIQLFMVRNT